MAVSSFQTESHRGSSQKSHPKEETRDIQFSASQAEAFKGESTMSFLLYDADGDLDALDQALVGGGQVAPTRWTWTQWSRIRMWIRGDRSSIVMTRIVLSLIAEIARPLINACRKGNPGKRMGAT